MKKNEDIKNMINTRKNIFLVLKEKMNDKILKSKNNGKIDESYFFNPKDDVDMDSYNREAENMEIYKKLLEEIDSENSSVEESLEEDSSIEKKEELEEIAETQTKEEFMKLYKDLMDGKVSAYQLSLSDLIKANSIMQAEMNIYEDIIDENESLKKEIKAIEEENSIILKKIEKLGGNEN